MDSPMLSIPAATALPAIAWAFNLPADHLVEVAQIGIAVFNGLCGKVTVGHKWFALYLAAQQQDPG